MYDPTTDAWGEVWEDQRLRPPVVRFPYGSIRFFGGPEVTLLDPGTGSLASHGASLLPREMSSAAALLPSGQVLLAGGDLFSNIAAEPEIWDPRTGAGMALTGCETAVKKQLSRLTRWLKKRSAAAPASRCSALITTEQPLILSLTHEHTGRARTV